MNSLKSNPGIFAVPSVDFVFKRIFGSERFKAATIGLLNSLLDDVNVVDLTFLNTVLTSESEEQKTCLIDVLCQDDAGNQFIVEMQNAKQVNFMQRMVFYASKLISNQPGLVGNNAYALHPTYVIAFLNFDIVNISQGLQKDCYAYHFKNTEVHNGFRLPASPEFHFFVLEKFNKSEDEIVNEEDYWLYLLSKSHTLTDAPEWADSADSYKAYFDASLLAGFSQMEVQKYHEEMLNEIDRIGSIECARQEGIERGIEQEKQEVAAEMKKVGLSVDVIARCTGLTLERIAEL